MKRILLSWTSILVLRTLFLMPSLIGQPLDGFQKDYVPIRMEGDFPAEILEKVSARTERELRKDGGELGEDAYAYYAYSNYALNRAFQSGDIYFGGEITAYLSELLDSLLVDQPELRSQLKVYGTRIELANASSWRDGTLFFNIPLLVYLENEAQLAYILAHEISHYTQAHVLRQFKKIQELSVNNIGEDQDAAKLMEVRKYSRGQELEADSLGLQMILASPYAPSEALTALSLMQKVDNPSLGQIHDMLALFGVDSISTRGQCICDSSELFRKVGLVVDGASLLGLTNNRQEPQALPDSLATHPSIEARMEAIGTQLARLGGASKEKRTYVLGEERFRKIQLTAFFELVQKGYEEGQYAASLYTSLLLLQDFPQNRYLNLMAAKNMYWLAFYNNLGDRKELFFKEDRYRTLSYGSYACMMGCFHKSGFYAFARMFIRKKQETFPDEPELMILRAQMAEIVRDTLTAQTYYIAYLDTAPDGPLYQFAKYRLSKQ